MGLLALGVVTNISGTLKEFFLFPEQNQEVLVPAGLCLVFISEPFPLGQHDSALIDLLTVHPSERK